MLSSARNNMSKMPGTEIPQTTKRKGYCLSHHFPFNYSNFYEIDGIKIFYIKHFSKVIRKKSVKR